jgi:flagellar motility protein MotE (MotC chaperone)
MKRTLPAPRLLPMAIAAMAALLVAKSVALVRAAVPEGGATAAHAEPSHPTPPAKHEEAKPTAGKSAAAPSAPAACAVVPAAVTELPMSDSERALLLDLRGRRAELETQDAALAARAAVLAAAEKRLSVRVEELGSLQRRLEALETGRKERDEANWRGLVRLYETMKPRDAAVIFNDLDLPVLLPVLDRMKESRAAPVLAAMQPDRARQITAELAQLRTRANTPAQPAPRSTPAPMEEKK